MNIKLVNLNKTIVNCKKCPRLVKFIQKISTQKRKQNINEVYWGKPVPGFGNLNSKLAIIGLAPAAHGGTRTGRARQSRTARRACACETCPSRRHRAAAAPRETCQCSLAAERGACSCRTRRCSQAD